MSGIFMIKNNDHKFQIIWKKTKIGLYMPHPKHIYGKTSGKY